MGHALSDNVNNEEIRNSRMKGSVALVDDFVLEKSIFSNVFEKDIRRVFIYKKAERLAKAIHLIAPAFADSAALRNRIDAIGVALVEAAILPSGAAREGLSRELLSLSSILSIARAGGLLSRMNTDLIAREAHLLLQEVAEYEEPRLFLDEALTLSGIAKKVQMSEGRENPKERPASRPAPRAAHKGHIKDTPSATGTNVSERREGILSVIKNKKVASIKDISAHIRDVSEKTIQRELLSLIADGIVVKEGERRWSTYSLA